MPTMVTSTWFDYFVCGWLISPGDDSDGICMISRDDKGAVIFATYRRMYFCSDALESEIHAINECTDSAIQHTTLQVLL